VEKLMRIAFTALLLGAAAATATSQPAVKSQPEDAGPPFTLEITANLDKNQVYAWDFVNNAQTVVKAGSMVKIARRKTNLTDHEIKRRSDADDGSEARDGSGNLVKLRAIGPVAIGGGPTMLKGTKDNVLEPGESKIYCDCFGTGYDFDEPGTYTIQVWEHVSDDPKSEVVKSNIITITVLPADAPPPTQPGSGPGEADNRNRNGDTGSKAHYDHLNARPSPSQMPRAIPSPTFSLAVEEDKGTWRADPSLHRVMVKFTHTAPGVELEQFHPESENMVNMIVLRDGRYSLLFERKPFLGSDSQPELRDKNLRVRNRFQLCLRNRIG
jgi:hypothetical protein